MACSNISGEYLSYNCYSKLKRYFDNTNLSDDSKAILQLTIKQLKNKPRNFNENDKIFSGFACHLQGDGAFLGYYNDATCTYINFWLNNQIQRMYKYVYGSNFDIFLDFSEKFAIERKKKYLFPHSCKTYLRDLGDEFQKRQILYRFYDLYTELKKGKNEKTNNIPCDNINLMVSEYNNNKNSIENDKDFQKHFKDLINIIKNETPHGRTCNNYHKLDYVLPKEIPPPKVEAQEAERDRLITVESSPNGQHTDLGHRTDVRETDDKSVLLETEKLPPKPTLPTEQMVTNVEINPSEVTYKEQLHINHSPEDQILTTLQQAEEIPTIIPQGKQILTTLSQDKQEYRTRSLRDELNTELAPRATFPGEESVSLDQKVYPREDTNTIRGNTGGIFGTIGDSVINVLGEVDPVPVVGVSGGMGALFLLFKYTPVGTFFRGGRRRMHQIPSTFRGEYPFGFPGFPEYDDRYFGNDRYHISYQAE
ncbi:hypothetical protein, conserved [Plasmodium vivax]|uniref:VIR protein n=1 Tax=Plasmodium vivax TaxID=5855 RepID=A0A1G4EBU1_PLAVI|nr:hypothetical protein, conserved [Plasmodium vivax]